MSSEEIQPDAEAELCPECDLIDIVYPVNQPTQEEQENCVFSDDVNWEKVKEKKWMFSESTIRQLWIDDYKKCILGEVDELRERGVAEDVAEQLEHLAERFEEVFSSDER